MPVELEAKMKVASLDEVKQKLIGAGATHTGDVFEINVFFDTEDRSLLAADQGLRLRVNRDEATSKESYIMTYKGPRQHGNLKSREERELEVANMKDAEKFLDALGYQKVLSFEKRRNKWKLGGCAVELDELPHLGTYVEVEGPDEASIMNVRNQIGLTKAPIIKTSYIAMLMNMLQEKGSLDKIVTFAKK